MAYNCTAGCPRVLHFSNPSVSYGGATTGTSVQHDNARSLNNAASTIANWRQAVGGGTPPTITALSNVMLNEDTATAPIAFTVGDAETAATSLLVTAASSNAALVPNSSAGLALGGAGASRTLVVIPAAHQFGTATIEVGARRRVLAVPDSALVEDDLTGEVRAARVDGGGRAIWTTLRLGAAGSGWHELLEPTLAPGTPFIIVGQHGLADSTRVKPQS